MKKVLIITYYWPPSGGAGVQRWLKTTKYLRKYGWEPVIYTPENPEAPAYDDSLLREVPQGVEVLKTKIWEPYSVYQKLMGKKQDHSSYLSKEGKKSMVKKLAEWVRSNVFIPDPRMFWIKPSVKYLTNYLKKHPVDAIVSTGPPHSMHLIALGVKKKTGTPWLADFRDPWTFIDFFHHLPLSQKSLKKHAKLEKEVVSNADARTVVSPSWKSEYEELTAESFELIYNGYDKADFDEKGEVLPDKEFTICHIGSLNVDRNPESLWRVLSKLVKENKTFEKQLKIKLIGKVNPETLHQIEQNKLKSYLEYVPYMEHEQVLRETQKAQLLLLLINNAPNVSGIIPGKVYEYMASKRPILALGALHSDAVSIIRETKSGEAIPFDDHQALEAFLRSSFEQYERNEFNVEAEKLHLFTREGQAKTFSEVLDRITSK